MDNNIEVPNQEWRVGEFWSSANPGTKVLILCVGDAIQENEAHRDFLRWVYADTKEARVDVYYGQLHRHAAAQHRGDDELADRIADRLDGLHRDVQPLSEDEWREGCYWLASCVAKWPFSPALLRYPNLVSHCDNMLAKEPFRREQPSDQALAQAFWRRSHCQTHDAKACAFVEQIVHEALCIEKGLPIEPTINETYDNG